MERTHYWSSMILGGGVILLISLVAINPVGAASCAPLPHESGLVSWWPGDGNADDIQNGNDGTLLGGTFFTPAKVGEGFTFDSDDDRVTIPHNANLNVNSPGFTAEFWMWGVKNQPQSLYVPVEKSHGFVDNTGWAFQGLSATGGLGFLIGAGGGPPFTNFIGVGTAKDLLDGNFHHVAGTWDGSTIRMYVDGVLETGTASLSTPFNNTRALTIGFAAGGGSPQRFFRGQVDELSIYNRALNLSDIQAIFNAGSAGKCVPEVPLCQPIDPIEGIDNAISDINDLGLDPDTTEKLVEKLEEAKDKFTSGDLHDARSKIFSFVGELEAAVEAGNVPKDAANALLNQAGAILAAMQFP